MPFTLSGVCSPSEANYCSNPFEVFFLRRVCLILLQIMYLCDIIYRIKIDVLDFYQIMPLKIHVFFIPDYKNHSAYEIVLSELIWEILCLGLPGTFLKL